MDDYDQAALDDAIIEDTCHCDLCGSSFVLGGNDHVIVTLEGPAQRVHGTLGAQLKLCVECSSLVYRGHKEILDLAGICEHGVNDGEYCEDCNREYKRARLESGDDDAQPGREGATDA